MTEPNTDGYYPLAMITIQRWLAGGTHGLLGGFTLWRSPKQTPTKNAFCESVPRSRLEIPLKLDRALLILKAEMQHYLPRPILGRMRRPASIMGSKPLIEVGSDALARNIHEGSLRKRADAKRDGHSET
jgi:hypothetical protein